MLQLDNSRLIHTNGKIIFDQSVLPIEGLLMWFDSSYTNLPNLSRLQNFSDRSGNGYDLVQNDTNRQPLLKTGVLNGKSVMEYDLDFLYDPVNPGKLMVTKKSPYLFMNGKTVESFIVGRFMSAIPLNSQSLFLRTRDGQTNQPIFRHLAINQFQRAVSNVVDDNGIAQNLALNAFALNPLQWYLFYIKQEIKIFYNRTLSIDGVGTISTSSISNINLNNRSLTTLGNTGNQTGIQIAEVITTSTETGLTGFDVNFATNYLKQKYNI